jgi:hypothetical protein
LAQLSRAPAEVDGQGHSDSIYMWGITTGRVLPLVVAFEFQALANRRSHRFKVHESGFPKKNDRHLGRARLCHAEGNYSEEQSRRGAASDVIGTREASPQLDRKEISTQRGDQPGGLYFHELERPAVSVGQRRSLRSSSSDGQARDQSSEGSAHLSSLLQARRYDEPSRVRNADPHRN